MNSQIQAPSALSPEEEPRCPVSTRLSGPQRFWTIFKKNILLVPAGIRTPDRLRHPKSLLREVTIQFQLEVKINSLDNLSQFLKLSLYFAKYKNNFQSSITIAILAGLQQVIPNGTTAILTGLQQVIPNGTFYAARQ